MPPSPKGVTFDIACKFILVSQINLHIDEKVNALYNSPSGDGGNIVAPEMERSPAAMSDKD
jgi:hypothetical protein